LVLLGDGGNIKRWGLLGDLLVIRRELWDSLKVEQHLVGMKNKANHYKQLKRCTVKPLHQSESLNCFLPSHVRKGKPSFC
jgi:hypothetical protein